MDDRAVTDDVEFRARLPATPASIGIFREQLQRWLEQVHVSAAQMFDIVLACSESLTLVIQEQPRRVALVVDVVATLEDGDLVLTTRDYGLWHETHKRAREEPLGVSLMRALMDSVELERHGDGQRITLRKRVSITNCEPRALPM
jgi:anti-sigma regulatory factor (Ser/Thr protein kinase)